MVPPAARCRGRIDLLIAPNAWSAVVARFQARCLVHPFNGPDWTVDEGQRWLAWRHHQNAARTMVASATGLTS
jgi:hypothetical protein